MSTRASFPLVALLAGCTIDPIGELTSDDGAPEPSSDSGAGVTGDPDDSTTIGADDSSTTGTTAADAESGGVTGDTSDADTGGRDCDPVGEGTTYVVRDYETMDPEELFVEPVATSTYVEGDCFEATNCWQVNPIATMGNEDHAGWLTAEIPELAEGGTRTMFVGHMLYVSSGMLEVMEQYRVGGKMLDGYMWDQPDGYGPTRQTVIWAYWNPENPSDEFIDTAASGVVPILLKGGAGDQFVRQLGAVQFDLRDYADQWIWTEYEFNADERYTAMWVKTPDGVFSGASCEPIMRRSADDPADWVHEYGIEAPYEYLDAAGWQTPGVLWGYWDDLEGAPLDSEDFVRVDHVVVSDAWITPPF
jgi:hypothetical protein